MYTFYVNYRESIFSKFHVEYTYSSLIGFSLPICAMYMLENNFHTKFTIHNLKLCTYILHFYYCVLEDHRHIIYAINLLTLQRLIG